MRMMLKPLSILLMYVVISTGCQKEAASFVNNDQDPPLVNAGPSQTIQSPVATTTLTGSGTTNNGGIAGYLWSLVSGPNVPVIMSPGSATTVVNAMVSGTYIFQFMVMDSAGLTGLDTMIVQVLPSLQQALTLQPLNNQTELNFAGYASGGNISSHDIDLDASAWTMGGNTYYTRGSVQFDLASIPAGATIISAKLSLYSIPLPINGNQVDANSGPDNSMFIRRITGNWSPLSSTWGTQPATTTVDQIVIPHTTASMLDLVDMDVTNMVTAMLPSGNHGFMMQLQNEVIYNARQFCSSTYSDASKHPKLVVVYQ